MKTITYGWLRRKGACEDQRDLAALHFGRAAPLTRQTLAEAAALGLDMDWLAHHLLTPAQWATYEAGCAPLWATYEAGCAPLWATYKAGRAPLLAAYEAGCAPLRADVLGLP